MPTKYQQEQGRLADEYWRARMAHDEDKAKKMLYELARLVPPTCPIEAVLAILNWEPHLSAFLTYDGPLSFNGRPFAVFRGLADYEEFMRAVHYFTPCPWIEVNETDGHNWSYISNRPHTPDRAVTLTYCEGDVTLCIELMPVEFQDATIAWREEQAA